MEGMGRLKEKCRENMEYFVSAYRTNSLYLYFILLFCGMILFYGSCIFFRSDCLKSILFHDINDTFMDFFNCIAAYSGNPYAGEVGTNYPPLAVLVFKFFRRMVPQEFHGCNGHELKMYSFPMIAFVLYNVPIIWLVFISVQRKIQDVKLRNLLFLILPFSFPVMFAVERGNIINLSFAFTLFFVCFYDSENRLEREAAFIALGLAAGIKIYPAIFGLLLLKRGKIKECIRLAFYGIVIFFAPFWRFGGLKAVKPFIRGLTGFVSDRLFDTLEAMAEAGMSVASISEAAGEGAAALNSIAAESETVVFPPAYGYNFAYKNISMIIQQIMGIRIPAVYLTTVLIVLTLALLISAFLLKEKWQEELCLLLIMILVPSVNMAYIMIFALIPLIELCSMSKREKSSITLQRERIYLFFTAMILIPWGFSDVKAFAEQRERLSGSFVLYFMCVVSLAFLAACEAGLVWIQNEKVQKNSRRAVFAATLLGTAIIMCKSMI